MDSNDRVNFLPGQLRIHTHTLTLAVSEDLKLFGCGNCIEVRLHWLLMWEMNLHFHLTGGVTEGKLDCDQGPHYIFH